MTRGRGGFALVSSLIAVVLIGALIVGAFVAATEEVHISGGVKSATRALMASESTVEGDAAEWASSQADSLQEGGRTQRTKSVDGFQVTTTLVRLNSSVFWLIGEAADRPGSEAIRRRIGLLLRKVTDSTGHGSLLRLEQRGWSELF